MKISIMTITKEKYAMVASPAETISEIKTRIETELKLGKVKHLIYSGSVLKSSDTLEALGIPENAIVMVLLQKKKQLNKENKVTENKVTKENRNSEEQNPKIQQIFPQKRRPKLQRKMGNMTKKKLLEMMRQKDEIERKIKDLQKLGNDALYGSLVDKDGFPRSDVDVHGLRIHRNNLARLQTDHKNIMKQIETAMFEYHKQLKTATTTTTATTATTTITTTTTTTPTTTTIPAKTTSSAIQVRNPRDAFFLVDNVMEDSPAQLAGLCIGDKVLQFGTVHKKTANIPQSLGRVVKHSIGTRVPVTVYRVGKGIVDLSLVPKKWPGRGLLGCRLQPIE